MSQNISVYMVVNLTINDPKEYRIYEKDSFLIYKSITDHLLPSMIIEKF